MSQLMLKGRVYDFFKNLAQLYLPAVGTAYVALSSDELLSLPAPGRVSGSIVVVCTLLGTILKLSQVSYNNSEERFDGTAYVDPLSPTNNPTIMLKNPEDTDPGELRLKVQQVDLPSGNINQDEPDDPLPLE